MAEAKKRKTRSDKKPAGEKFGSLLHIKMTPAGREMLAEQARRAGYDSSGHYLRALASNHRLTIGMAAYDYNGGLERAALADAENPGQTPTPEPGPAPTSG